MGKKKEIQINGLTVDELKKLIGEVLNSYFGNMKSSSTEIIGIDEVCKITGLSKHTVYIHIPEHTRSLSGSLLGYKTIP